MKTPPAVKEEWRFRDAPDWPRVCRELQESGCAVALVTIGSGPGASVCTLCTLVDYGARLWPQHALRLAPATRIFKAGDWSSFPGDLVAEFLKPPLVKVQGYG